MTDPNARAAAPHRIALLIDADNSPAAKIDVVLAELAKLGVANIRRAYGNWKKNELKGWEAVLHEYAIRPIQQFDVSKGWTCSTPIDPMPSASFRRTLTSRRW